MNDDKFFEWWNADELDENLHVRKDSPLYWAMQGWLAAIRYEDTKNRNIRVIDDALNKLNKAAEKNGEEL